MAYLGQETEMSPPDSFETESLEAAFQQFTNGDILGAATTLGPVGMVQAGLISTGVGAVFAAAIGVGLALIKLVGRGRTEADIIVPIQNQLINPSGTGQLDQITQLLVRNPNVSGLQALYDQVQRIGLAFQDYIEDPGFHDGRASEQAANSIFPYINGTCGYHWPPPMKPTQQECLTWGEGTPGGAGRDGMLGAIARAILRQGGEVPPPVLTQGYGSTVPSLQYSGSQIYPFITQSGTLPANAPLSPLRARAVPTVSAGLDLTSLALIGGAAFLLLRNRG